MVFGISNTKYFLIFNFNIIIVTKHNKINELLLLIKLFLICHFFVSKLKVKCSLSVYHVTYVSNPESMF